MAKQGKDIDSRLAEIERKLDALGPLAHAYEAPGLRGRQLAGGRRHPISWEDLGCEPGQAIILDMERGSVLTRSQVIRDEGVVLMFAGAPNLIRRAWIVP